MDAGLNPSKALGAASQCVVPAESGKGVFALVDTVVPTESEPWVVDPDDAMTLYALGQRVLRSSDGGRTWCTLSWPGPARSLLFAHQPSPALYLAVGDDGDRPPTRLMKSHDGGQTWANTGSLSRVAFSDLWFRPDRFVLVDGADGPVFLTMGHSEILRSTDEGSTWEQFDPRPASDLPQPRLRRLLVSSGPAPVVFIEARATGSTFTGVLLVSTDAGESFAFLPLPENVVDGALPSNDQISLDCQGRVYISRQGQVHRSSDNGWTWDLLKDLGHTAIMALPASTGCADSFYGSGLHGQQSPALWQVDLKGNVQWGKLPSSGLLVDLGGDRLLLSGDLHQRSDDGGLSWWVAGVPLGNAKIAISPAREGRMFAATLHGIARSDDKGRSWQAGARVRRDPSPHSSSGFSALHLDPLDANTVYADSKLSENKPWTFVSHDAGDSFVPWPVPSAAAPEFSMAIAPSATVAGTVTVVTTQGVSHTNDAGKHFAPWLVVPRPGRVANVAIGAGEPLAIYLSFSEGNGGPFEPIRPLKLSASLDGGVTWAVADTQARSIHCLVVNPAVHSVAFACAANLNNESPLLRTLDGGKSWAPIPKPGNEPVVRLSIDPRPPHALYAQGRSLYRSDDNGDTWRDLAAYPSNRFEVWLDPHPGGARYTLGQTGALYRMVEAF